MANAVCTKCRANVHWHAGRGCRLLDISCACGGKLSARRDESNARTVASGHTFEPCWFCGKKRKRNPNEPAAKCWYHCREYWEGSNDARAKTREDWARLWHDWDFAKSQMADVDAGNAPFGERSPASSERPSNGAVSDEDARPASVHPAFGERSATGGQP